jgi:hypothetical protein
VSRCESCSIALGDGVEAERIGQREDGAGERDGIDARAALAIREPLDERAVDLEDVDGKRCR